MILQEEAQSAKKEEASCFFCCCRERTAGTGDVRLSARMLSPRVNSPANSDEELLEEVPGKGKGALFG